MGGFQFLHVLLAASSLVPTVLGAAIDTDLVFGRQDTWPASLAGEAHDQSWPEFSQKTQRWSTFSAPTFNEVFIPQNENDLVRGVNMHPQILDTSLLITR